MSSPAPSCACNTLFVPLVVFFFVVIGVAFSAFGIFVFQVSYDESAVGFASGSPYADVDVVPGVYF